MVAFVARQVDASVRLAADGERAHTRTDHVAVQKTGFKHEPERTAPSAVTTGRRAGIVTFLSKYVIVRAVSDSSQDPAP